MAWPKVPRHIKGGSHGRKVQMHQTHRRSGAKKGFSRRVNSKLFRGRTVNAPRRMW